MIPEREREALMRLTMCAREECGVCKYKDTCNFEFQYEIATENMNILADALRVADTPQTDSTGSPIGDYRDGVGAWQTEREGE
jgi:hypothetical protein